MKKYILVLSLFMFVGTFALATSANAFTYTSLLKQGSTGSQVLELQKILNANGFVVSTSGVGSLGQETSYFGSKTKEAVKAFQLSKNLSADGIIGSNTGSALNVLSVATTYPSGCVSASGYSSTTGAKCYALPSNTAVPTGCTWAAGLSSITGESCVSAPVITGVSGPVSLNINQSGTWTVSAYDIGKENLSYKVEWNDPYFDTASSQNSSMPVVQQTATFSHSYSRSGTYTPVFTVTNNSGKSATTSISVVVNTQSIPALVGIVGPESLSVNQSGTWTVNVLTTASTSLSYYATWGDIPTSSLPIPQTSPTFTHTYLTAGTYTPTFTVTDNNTGLSAQTKMIVDVSTSLEVTAPKSGEQWTTGKTYTIKWTPMLAASVLSVPTVTISITSPTPACLNSTPACLLPIPQPYIITQYAPNSGSYVWTIPNPTVADVVNPYNNYGEQQITVSINGTDIQGTSEIFTVTNSSVSTTPPVIAGVSGSQSLYVNQSGTWTVSLLSVASTSLSYYATWGDVSAGALPIPQTSPTFTHTYLTAGTYTPTFTVTDNNTGLSAQKSLSVIVNKNPVTDCLSGQLFSSVTGKPCSSSNSIQP